MFESLILAQSVTPLFMPYILDFIFPLHKKYNHPLHKSALQTPDVLPRPLMFCCPVRQMCEIKEVLQKIFLTVFFPLYFYIPLRI